jgi:hypothetical protein
MDVRSDRMKAIVKVVEKVFQEAYINIPDGLSEDAIKKHITDLYNTGDINLDIVEVQLTAIAAEIIKSEQ